MFTNKVLYVGFAKSNYVNVKLNYVNKDFNVEFYLTVVLATDIE